MHLFCKINQVSLQHYLFQVELSCILESPTKRTSPLISKVIKILCLEKSYVQEDWFKTDNQTGYLKQMTWSYMYTLYMYMTVYVVVNFLSQVILFLFFFCFNFIDDDDDDDDGDDNLSYFTFKPKHYMQILFSCLIHCTFLIEVVGRIVKISQGLILGDHPLYWIVLYPRSNLIIISNKCG